MLCYRLQGEVGEGSDQSLTPHRFRIRKLRRPSLLRFCKSSLRRREKVEETRLKLMESGVTGQGLFVSECFLN